jgi:hypothetical protein
MSDDENPFLKEEDDQYGFMKIDSEEDEKYVKKSINDSSLHKLNKQSTVQVKGTFRTKTSSLVFDKPISNKKNTKAWKL